MVRNLILKYSELGDLILDPFLGSGTTLIEAKLLGRRGIGIDINPEFVRGAYDRIEGGLGQMGSQAAILGDARHLPLSLSGQIQLALLHPPYFDAIIYSGLPGDLSTSRSVSSFCAELSSVLYEIRRVLAPEGIMAIMIGDLRRQRKVVPLGFQVLHACLRSGFILMEIIIKIQHNCHSSVVWKPAAERLGFLLLQHEYIFVFSNSHLPAQVAGYEFMVDQPQLGSGGVGTCP